MGIIKKPTLWKKVTKKFKKDKKSIHDNDDLSDLLDCKPLAKEIKDKAKKDKRKAVLKDLGHRTLMICRYMGMGAALASPAHFTTSPSPYYPGNEANYYYRPDYPCYY